MSKIHNFYFYFKRLFELGLFLFLTRLLPYFFLRSRAAKQAEKINSLKADEKVTVRAVSAEQKLWFDYCAICPVEVTFSIYIFTARHLFLKFDQLFTTKEKME